MTDVDGELLDKIVANTQRILGKHLKRPPLTAKLLKKPPFRYLHDIVCSVIKEHGFLMGLYNETELIADNVKERDAKINFLTKLIDALKAVTKKDIKARPNKVIAGLEPEDTNLLLQAIGNALTSKLDTKEYVRAIKKKNVDNETTTKKTSTTTKKKVGNGKEENVVGGKSIVKEEKLKKRITKNDAEASGNVKTTLKRDANNRSDNSGSNRSSDERRLKQKTTKDVERNATRKKTTKIGGVTATTTTTSSRRKQTNDIHEKTSESLKKQKKIDDEQLNKQTIEEEFVADYDESDGTDYRKGTKTDDVEEASSLIATRDPTLKTKDAAGILTTNEDASSNLTVGDTSNVLPTVPPPPLSSSSALTDTIASSPPTIDQSMNNLTGPSTTTSSSTLRDRSERPKSARPRSGDYQRQQQHQRDVPSSSDDVKEPIINDDVGGTNRPPSKIKPEAIQIRPKSSLRPPSVRPSSARPGAPRLRQQQQDDVNVNNGGEESTMVQMGKINVIVESYSNNDNNKDDGNSNNNKSGFKAKKDDGEDEDDEEETVVVIVQNEDDRLDTNESIKLNDLPVDKGHLVEQILEQINEEDVQEHSVASLKRTNVDVINWERDGIIKNVTNEINDLRRSIQSLTRSANPLGKLLNYVQEDVETMQNEFVTWSNVRKQLINDIDKQNRLNEESIKPLEVELKELNKSIEKQVTDITRMKSIIYKNDRRILTLTERLLF